MDWKHKNSTRFYYLVIAEKQLLPVKVDFDEACTNPSTGL